MTDPAHHTGSASAESPRTEPAGHTGSSGAAAPAAAEAADVKMLELAESLFDAARTGDLELLRTYLDAGVPVALTNAAGDSLLMLAAYHGHAVLTAFLVERGAEVNTLNDRGQSPLAGAVFKGYTDVVRVLLAAGADADSGNPSARATAQYFQRPELLELF